MDRSSVKVSYLGDASDLARASRKARGELDTVGSKASKMGGLVGKAFGGLAAGGIALFGGALKVGFDEVKDYQTGVADLNNTLKTTKNVAGITTAQMEDLASSIEGYSGQTDDSIVKAEGLLLTFTKIRNVAGKNNDIFTQATKLSADMAQKFGGEASDSAIRLGKALNDPIKGVTALSKIGVSFTEGQKKQIAAMQKSGDILGAQKIILAELQTEVGGAAQAYGGTLAGQVDRAKRAFEGASQQLATALLPAITSVMNYVTTVALPAFQTFTGQMQSGEGAGGKFARTLTSIWQAAQSIGRFLMPILSFMVGHPQVFTSVAIGAAALGAAFKVQAIYGAIVARFMPGLAVSTVAQGTAAGTSATANAANAASMRAAAGSAGLLAAAMVNVKYNSEKYVDFLKANPNILDRLGVNPDAARQKANKDQERGAQGTTGRVPGKVIPLARGGLVKARPGGVLANIAEGGEDEAVIPLSRLRGGGGGGGGQPLVVNLMLDGRIIHTTLLKLKRTSGGELGLA